MSYVDVKPFVYPGEWGRQFAGVHRTVTLNAASEAAGAIVQVNRTGTINKIGWRTATVTTGADITAAIEGVGTSDGLPDGTAVDSAVETVADTDDNTWKTTTLSTGASVTAGDIIAVTLTMEAASPGNMGIAIRFDDANKSTAFPYCVEDVGAGWAKIATDSAPILALGYDDGTYDSLLGVYPVDAYAAQSNFRVDGSPDEIGNLFKLDAAFRVIGLHMLGEWNASALDFDMVLYDTTVGDVDDGAAAALATHDHDGDIGSFQAGQFNSYFRFTSPVELLAGKWYRAICKAQGSINGMTVSGWTFDSAAVMEAFMGSGANWHHTQRVNGGDWTETTTKTTGVNLIVDGIGARAPRLINGGLIQS